MIKKFKLFISPIPALEKWLNKMSSEGYRLVKAGKIFFYFERCERNKYVYAVDYVANKSYDDLMEYENFLEQSKIKYIEKSGNVGKFSLWNIRWRPYADKGAKIATSNGMINREFLILEKENDGKPFDIYTTIGDKINALKNMRKPTVALMFLIGFLFLMNMFDFIPTYKWTLYEINLLSNNSTALLLVLGIIETLLLINFIRFTLAINELKRESKIHE